MAYFRKLSIAIFGVTLVVAGSSLCVSLDVSSSSMEDTFVDGDHIVVETVGLRVPALGRSVFPVRRGDCVVFHAVPGNPFFFGKEDQLFVKRVIAVPGDNVRVDKSVVFLNGMPLKEPYVKHDRGYSAGADIWPPSLMGSQSRDVLVPPNSFFVLGDHREGSFDSRVWGLLPEASLVGVVLLRVPRMHSSGTHQRERNFSLFGSLTSGLPSSIVK